MLRSGHISGRANTNTTQWSFSRAFLFEGDSIQNIIGDLLSCSLGYIIGTTFAALDLWWLSLVWILLSEVGCVLYMRDSLLLNLLTLLVHSDKLVSWQLSKVPQEANTGFISRLWAPKKLC